VRLNIYVAGRTNNVAGVRLVQTMVRENGHTVTHDWTQIVEELGGGVGDAHVQASRDEKREYARADREGVSQADLVIAVCSPQLCGTLIEIGMALIKRKPVWLLGEPERETVFFELEEVVRLENERDLYTRLCDLRLGRTG
jgi:nucleoside 2-deoxyribosyltransferase